MCTTTRQVVWVGCVLVATLAAISGAGASLPPPEWVPSESVAGGRQADARLDSTIAFWEAGVTLPSVFAELTRQTGVGLGFYPENDENRRVRVNLFLNKERPPTLREVMAQLAWTLDCPFSVSEEGGKPVYRLFSTSIGRGAAEALQHRQEDRVRALDRLYTAVNKKLDECRAALMLTREELIARYRGKDDLLLLSLLDPPRRAAAEFICRHLSDARPTGWQNLASVDAASVGPGVSEQEYTSADRADLQAACGRLPGWANVSVKVGPGAEAEVALQAPGAGGPDGGLPLGPRRSFRYQMAIPGMSEAVMLANTVIFTLPPPAELAGRDALQLRRCLGEEIDPEQAAEFVKQRDAECEAAARARERAAEEAARNLSPEAARRLASLTPPFTGSEGYPAWQLFEQLAKASGYHVISDAFETGGPAVPLARGAAYAEPFQPLMPRLDPLTFPHESTLIPTPAYEWGDAGTFLHFRSVNRGICRAALLPEEFTAWVDGLIQPYLPHSPKARAVDFVLPLDLEQWAPRLSRLTDAQLLLGGRRNRAAPNDLAGNARDEVLQAVLQRLGPDLLHLLASLDTTQWARLRATGLTAPGDFTPEQERLVRQWLRSAPEPGIPDDYGRATITLSTQSPGLLLRSIAAGGHAPPDVPAPDTFWTVSARIWPSEDRAASAAAPGQDGPVANSPTAVSITVDLSADSGPAERR